MKILIVEDDASIANSLKDLLTAEGYEVYLCARQDEATLLLNRDTFALALLDISLAQGSGFAVCAAAKEARADMPVIFLTASDDEYSTVAGLDMGATDYIAKPFRPRELLSRIRAALRANEGASASTILIFEQLRLDTSKAALFKNDNAINLTALEYRLLLYMLQNQGRLVTRETLRDVVWDSAGEFVDENTINVYIRRLREKIEDNPSEPTVIKTVRGLGYRIG